MGNYIVSGPDYKFKTRSFSGLLRELGQYHPHLETNGLYVQLQSEKFEWSLKTGQILSGTRQEILKQIPSSPEAKFKFDPTESLASRIITFAQDLVIN